MFGLLDESLGFVINKTALALKSELDKKLKTLDITAVQFAILKRLYEEDGLSQKEIANRTFKKTAEITHIIDKLEKKGYVERVEKKGDRREYRIELTSRGKEIEESAIQAAYETLEIALQGISDNDVKAMLSNLDKIYKNLN